MKCTCALINECPLFPRITSRIYKEQDLKRGKEEERAFRMVTDGVKYGGIR